MITFRKRGHVLIQNILQRIHTFVRNGIPLQRPISLAFYLCQKVWLSIQSLCTVWTRCLENDFCNCHHHICLYIQTIFYKQKQLNESNAVLIRCKKCAHTFSSLSTKCFLQAFSIFSQIIFRFVYSIVVCIMFNLCNDPGLIFRTDQTHFK